MPERTPVDLMLVGKRTDGSAVMLFMGVEFVAEASTEEGHKLALETAKRIAQHVNAAEVSAALAKSNA